MNSSFWHLLGTGLVAFVFLLVALFALVGVLLGSKREPESDGEIPDRWHHASGHSDQPHLKN